MNKMVIGSWFGADVREQTYKVLRALVVDWVTACSQSKGFDRAFVSDYRWLPEKNSTTSSPIKTRGG